MDADHELPADWEARDSHACFFEYIELVRQQWLAGDHDLPPLFRPAPRPAEQPAIGCQIRRNL